LADIISLLLDAVVKVCPTTMGAVGLTVNSLKLKR